MTEASAVSGPIACANATGDTTPSGVTLTIDRSKPDCIIASQVLSTA